MIKQLALNFKLGITKEKITPRSGVAIYAQILKNLDIDSLVDKYMPMPGSNRGYKPSSYIIPLMLMLFSGGRHIEDLKELMNDNAVTELLGIRIPSPSTFGDWMRRHGRIGIKGLNKVIYEINKKVLSLDASIEYTLFIDPTMIEADKEDAFMTYMGFKGYRPIVAILNKLPIIIFHEFRNGNVSGPDAEILDNIFKLMESCGKRIKHCSVDSEFYSSSVIGYLTKKNVTFTTSAVKTSLMKETLRRMDNWTEFKTIDDITTDRFIGEGVYCLEGEPFRIVALRWINGQPDLFEKDRYCYHVIATNLEVPKEEVVYEYNKRVSIEGVIKEIKNGIGLEDMPSGDYFANALFFAVGVLVYNTTVIIKFHLLPEEYKTKTVESLRWSIVNIAGRLVRHGRMLVLLLASTIDKLILYERMRNERFIFA